MTSLLSGEIERAPDPSPGKVATCDTSAAHVKLMTYLVPETVPP